jgi:hypothetical protein
MSHVRTLVSDLVERRLWPVALLLAVALAAVPVVLGRGGGDASTAALPAAPATGTASGAGTAGAEKAEITIDTSVPAVRDRPGRLRNPFKSAAVAAKPKAAAAAGDTPASSGSAATGDPSAATSDTSAATSGGTSGGAGTSTSSPSTSSPSTGSSDSGATHGDSGTTTGGSGTTKTKTAPKTKTTAPTAEDTTDTYHVSVRFGVDGGKLETIRDVARLSPLPSVTDPFFVYLGVLKVDTSKTKRAVFIVSSDATPNGEGACHPTKQDCETVELTVGQTAYFDSTAPDGKVTQYELQLAGIHKTAVKSEAKASAAFARHSVAGAELLRDAAARKVRAAAGARAYRYLPGAGLLVRAKRKHVSARAAAAGTLVPGLALVARKDQPGIPVWHSPSK